MAPSAVFVIVVRDIPVEKQGEWLRMAEELASQTWNEPGCNSYSFVKKETDVVPAPPAAGNGAATTRFVISEVWASQAQLESHFQTPHFKKLVPLMDALGTTVSITTYKDALPVQRVDPTTKLLVLYDSSTSCTRKMAALIAEGCAQIGGAVEVRLRCVPGSVNHWDKPGCRDEVADGEATFADVGWADGIACGTPTNLGCVSWRMKKFWDDLSQSGMWSAIDGKVGVSFSSQGGDGGGAELVCMAMNHIMLNFGFSVIGITDYVSFKKTCHYGAVCSKAPRDELDAMACRRLGTRLAEYTAYTIQGRQDCHPLKASKANDLARWGYPGIPPRDADPKELVTLNRMPHGPTTSPSKKQPTAHATTTQVSKPLPHFDGKKTIVAALAGVALGVAITSMKKK